MIYFVNSLLNFICLTVNLNLLILFIMLTSMNFVLKMTNQPSVSADNVCDPVRSTPIEIISVVFQ